MIMGPAPIIMIEEMSFLLGIRYLSDMHYGKHMELTMFRQDLIMIGEKTKITCKGNHGLWEQYRFCDSAGFEKLPIRHIGMTFHT